MKNCFVPGRCFIILTSCVHFLTTVPIDPNILGRLTNPCGYANVLVEDAASGQLGSGSDITIDAVMAELKYQLQNGASSASEVQRKINVRLTFHI